MAYITKKSEGGNGFVMIPEEITRDPGITLQRLKVLLAICAHADNQTGRAAPAVETIVERTGIARQHVSEALSDLVEMCWITRTRKGHGFTNVYYVTPKSRLKKMEKDDKKLRMVTAKWRSEKDQASRRAEIETKIAADSAKALERLRKIAEDEPEPEMKTTGIKDTFDEAIPEATADEIAQWPRKRAIDVGFSKAGIDAIPPSIVRYHGLDHRTFE